MLRTVKPKNSRVKRALQEREPQLKENPKSAVFVKTQTISDVVKTAMQDLYNLKKPNCINFNKKNEILPFEDSKSLEFWSDKNDSSLFLIGSHQKKRPHNLIFSRMFNYQLFDMLELGVENFKSMLDFNVNNQVNVGMKPLFEFTGELFDTHQKYKQFKSTILDFFRGENLSQISLAGLSHVISCVVGQPKNENDLPPLHFRVYSIQLLKSGTKTPRVELVEMGPSMDLTLRRSLEADDQLSKEAYKVPKPINVPKKRKNIEVDEMGDKVGRIHMEKQDLSKLQTRKVKALK